jgi:transposase-like protein
MTAATTTRLAGREPATGHARPEDFRHRAACISQDPEIFFPASEPGGPVYEAQVAAAKAVCAGCPVRAECLEWAADLPYGIAGGMTEDERRRHRAGTAGRRRSCGGPRRPQAGTRAEVAQAGQAALAAGWSPQDVAREFGVTERTAYRWVTRASYSTTATGKAVGSAGGNRAPHLISQQHDGQAGTRAAEGIRS